MDVDVGGWEEGFGFGASFLRLLGRMNEKVFPSTALSFRKIIFKPAPALKMDFLGWPLDRAEVGGGGFMLMIGGGD